MKYLVRRYTPDMLRAVSAQSMVAVLINATVRGIVFMMILQLISFASTGKINGVAQMAILALVFAFIVFAVDIAERAWAQYRLKRSD